MKRIAQALDKPVEGLPFLVSIEYELETPEGTEVGVEATPEPAYLEDIAAKVSLYGPFENEKFPPSPGDRWINVHALETEEGNILYNLEVKDEFGQDLNPNDFELVNRVVTEEMTQEEAAQMDESLMMERLDTLYAT